MAAPASIIPVPAPEHYDPGVRVHVLHKGTRLPGRVVRRQGYTIEVHLDAAHPTRGGHTWVGSLLTCTLIKR